MINKRFKGITKKKNTYKSNINIFEVNIKNISLVELFLIFIIFMVI